MGNAKGLRKIASETYDRGFIFRQIKDLLSIRAKEGYFNRNFPMDGHRIESVRDLLEMDGFKIKSTKSGTEISW